jgi:hypothetical protein
MKCEAGLNYVVRQEITRKDTLTTSFFLSAPTFS